MTELDKVFDDFKSDVERVEHLLNLVKNFREFGASMPVVLGAEKLCGWPEATKLHESSKKIRTDLPILSGSLQLYLTGRFEYCIRQIVEAVADEMAAKVNKYVELPDSIRRELRVKTIEIAQNPRRYGYDEARSDALLEEFVKCKAATSERVNITSAVLSITESNMRHQVISDLLKRVGMQDFWKEVGKQTSIKLYLNKTGETEATEEAQRLLNEIMKERNQIAHPTGNTEFPDPDKVLRFARFLKALANTTADLAKIRLASFKPATATNN